MDLPCPIRSSFCISETLSGQYSLDIYTTVDSFNANSWNRCVPPSNLLMQIDYLSMLEQTQSSQMEFRYVFVKKNEATVGVAYFQLVPFTGHDLMNYLPTVPQSGFKRSLYAVGNALAKLLLKQINVKLLVSGNTFMTGENGFYASSDITPTERGVLLRHIVKQLQKEDAQIRAALISDLYAPKTDFDETFIQSGFSEITVEQDMAVSIRPEWKTFDDYMHDLHSKYRVRARKVFTLCNDAGVVCRNLTVDEIYTHSNTLYELYLEVMKNAGFKLSTLTPDFFAKQKEQLPNNYFVYAYFRNEQMIGFISVYKMGKKAEVHYTGMLHDLAKPMHLYQHMMYDMIKFGIEQRVEKLHFGRTAPEIKSTIGATGSAMYGYLKHFNLPFNYLVMRPFTRMLKPKQYVLRSPFKT